MSYVALVTERYDMVVEFYGQRLGSGNGGYGIYCCIGLEETTGLLRISDTDFAMQYNFGIMLQPWDHTRIGLRYLTETDLDFEDDPDLSWRDPIGQAVGQPNTKLDLGVTMPKTVHAGIHHQWNEDLALLASVGWEGFSEFSRVQVEVDTALGDVSTRLDADFRDVWHFGVGAEYKYNAKLDLTAGFNCDTSMSSSRTRPPGGSRGGSRASAGIACVYQRGCISKPG